jgi:hypothetical protein
MPSLEEKLTTLRESFGLEASASADEVVAHASKDALLAGCIAEGRAADDVVDVLVREQAAWRDAGLL